MRKTEIEVQKNAGSGFHYTFIGKNLSADADFDPTTGEAVVTLNNVTDMNATVAQIIGTIEHEAYIRKTNLLLPIRIDIHAGKYEEQLASVADALGLQGPIPADESGSEGLLYRAERPVPGYKIL